MTIHDERFYGHLSFSGQCIEIVAAEIFRQWLRTEIYQKRMLPDFPVNPENTAEFSWITIAQHITPLELKIHMIMFFRAQACRNNPQTARHAQMNHQRTRPQVYKQILGTTLYRQNLLSGNQ